MTTNTKKGSPKSRPGLSVEEKRNRDAKMQHFLNSLAIAQVAFEGWRADGFPYWAPIAAHAEYLNAVMPATRYKK